MPMEIHNLSMNWKVPSEPYVEDYCRRTAANVTPTVPAVMKLPLVPSSGQSANLSLELFKQALA